MSPPLPPPAVVIDTNVVLDWLLFADPGGQAVGAALDAGELAWIATAAMREEFFHVLGRGALDDWNPDLPAMRTRWEHSCRELPAPVPASLGTPLRCTDPDDQKFIDLAAAHPGALLLSRDRAVLKLGARLARRGVRVTTPARWAAARTPLEAAC